MDLIKNCFENLVLQQKTQADMYQEGYKAGYAEGQRKAREEFYAKEQEELERMAKDYDNKIN